MNRDLTVGNPSKVLWQFCLPLFGSIIFQQMYNIADSFVAGKFIGNNALAAVGNSYEVTLIFIAFAIGCNIGGSVVVAQFFGAKKYGKLKTAVYTTFIASVVVCAILMILGFLFSELLLKLIKTPAEVFDDSKLYLDIYLLGLPFVFCYNVSTGIFAALGDSKTPFIFLVISSLSNIAVDILFVKGFNMGVAGVAWATFLCQGISCILSVAFVLKRISKLNITEKANKFSLIILKDIAIVAIPSTLQQSFVSVGNIIIQGVINGFGTDAMAGYSAAIKLNNLVVTSLVTIGNGILNFTAQNVGAKKYDRISLGYKAGLKMVWGICIPIVVLYLLCGKYLMMLFMDNPDGQAMNIGNAFLRIVAPFYFVVSTKLVSDGILRGARLMKHFMSTTFMDLLIRVIFSIILAKTALGVIGIWVSWPIGWVISTIMSVVFVKGVKWEN